jgi:hypothetical protein
MNLSQEFLFYMEVPLLTHMLCAILLSFVTFLGPSNGFLQNNNASLIEIEGKQVQTLESSIAY